MLFDRHLVDALVTLQFVYGGVDLRVQEALVRALVPRASLALYLDVPADVAVSRKEGDVFGEYAVRRQLERYGALLRAAPGVRVLDGTRPLRENVLSAFGLVATTPVRRGGEF